MKLINMVIEALEGLWFVRLMALVWFMFALCKFRDHDWMFGTLCLGFMGHSLREIGLMKKLSR